VVIRTAACALAILGCATAAPAPPAGSSAVPAGAFAWRTLRAEHRVVLAAHDREGRPVVRKLHGLMLARRPDRFRVRALGPGDVTLFDLVAGAGGRCRLLEAARPPPEDIVRAVCEDLRWAYRLAPPSGGEAPEIRYADWQTVGREPVPMTIWLQNRARGYTVLIKAVRVELDVSVDDDALPAP